jgi:ATP-binding cassette subfamily C protein
MANAMGTEASRASEAYLCGATMAAFLIQGLVYAGVALLVSWKATLVSMVAGLAILYILNRLVKKARRAGKRQTNLLISLLSRLADSMQSIKPLKAMARETLAESVLQRDTTRLNKALQKQVVSREALRALQEPLLIIFLAIGLYVALVHWRMPLATLTVLVFLLARLLKQLNKLQQQYQRMVIFESAYWSLLNTIQEAEREREPALGSQTPSLVRGIKLERVTFAYTEHHVLRSASLSIPVGLLTAIGGPSGAGKTTVVDLVVGLLRPQQGEIWIDDLPLNQADLRSWRRMIGYVPQETLLLHDTVLINVTLGDTDVGEKDVIAALRAAGAWEFVSAMPQGIYSIVGERGGKISGGQRQRIAIARALVHKPKLLILDEATSALDPESEAAICNTLRQLRGELTILAISHQPALLHVADRAYRLEEGEAILVADLSAASSDSEDATDDSNAEIRATTSPTTGS